jgi:hypothetical protein
VIKIMSRRADRHLEFGIMDLKKDFKILSVT